MMKMIRRMRMMRRMWMMRRMGRMRRMMRMRMSKVGGMVRRDLMGRMEVLGIPWK